MSNGSFGGSNIAVWTDFNTPRQWVFETPAELTGTGAIHSERTALCSSPRSTLRPLRYPLRMRVRDVGNLAQRRSALRTYGFGEDDVTVLALRPRSFLPARPTSRRTEADLGWNIGCARSRGILHIQAAGGGTPLQRLQPGVTQNPYPAMGLAAEIRMSSGYVPVRYGLTCGPDLSRSARSYLPATTNASTRPDSCRRRGVHSRLSYNVAPPIPACRIAVPTMGGDVWFSVEVPASGEVNIDMTVNGGFTDGGMEAYSGTCAGP